MEAIYKTNAQKQERNNYIWLLLEKLLGELSMDETI